MIYSTIRESDGKDINDIIGMDRRKYKKLCRKKYIVHLDDVVIINKNGKGIVMDITVEDMDYYEGDVPVNIVISNKGDRLGRNNPGYSVIVVGTKENMPDTKSCLRVSKYKPFLVFNNKREHMKYRLSV